MVQIKIGILSLFRKYHFLVITLVFTFALNLILLHMLAIKREKALKLYNELNMFVYRHGLQLVAQLYRVADDQAMKLSSDLNLQNSLLQGLQREVKHGSLSSLELLSSSCKVVLRTAGESAPCVAEDLYRNRMRIVDLPTKGHAIIASVGFHRGLYLRGVLELNDVWLEEEFFSHYGIKSKEYIIQSGDSFGSWKIIPRSKFENVVLQLALRLDSKRQPINVVIFVGLLVLIVSIEIIKVFKGDRRIASLNSNLEESEKSKSEQLAINKSLRNEVIALQQKMNSLNADLQLALKKNSLDLRERIQAREMLRLIHQIHSSIELIKSSLKQETSVLKDVMQKCLKEGFEVSRKWYEGISQAAHSELGSRQFFKRLSEKIDPKTGATLMELDVLNIYTSFERSLETSLRTHQDIEGMHNQVSILAGLLNYFDRTTHESEWDVRTCSLLKVLDHAVKMLSFDRDFSKISCHVNCEEKSVSLMHVKDVSPLDLASLFYQSFVYVLELTRATTHERALYVTTKVSDESILSVYISCVTAGGGALRQWGTAKELWEGVKALSEILSVTLEILPPSENFYGMAMVFSKFKDIGESFRHVDLKIREPVGWEVAGS